VDECKPSPAPHCTGWEGSCDECSTCPQHHPNGNEIQTSIDRKRVQIKFIEITDLGSVAFAKERKKLHSRNFFRKKSPFRFVMSEKSTNFAPANKKEELFYVAKHNIAGWSSW
jgi:hypothetical protein